MASSIAAHDVVKISVIVLTVYLASVAKRPIILNAIMLSVFMLNAVFSGAEFRYILNNLAAFEVHFTHRLVQIVRIVNCHEDKIIFWCIKQHLAGLPRPWGGLSSKGWIK